MLKQNALKGVELNLQLLLFIAGNNKGYYMRDPLKGNDLISDSSPPCHGLRYGTSTTRMPLRLKPQAHDICTMRL